MKKTTAFLLILLCSKNLHAQQTAASGVGEAIGKGWTVTAVDNISVESIGVAIYPNPTAEKLVIDFSKCPQSKYTIKLKDIKGVQREYRRFCSIPNTEMREEIDLQEYAHGTYLLTVGNTSKTFTFKIIKTK